MSTPNSCLQSLKILTRWNPRRVFSLLIFQIWYKIVCSNSRSLIRIRPEAETIPIPWEINSSNNNSRARARASTTQLIIQIKWMTRVGIRPHHHHMLQHPNSSNNNPARPHHHLPGPPELSWRTTITRDKEEALLGATRLLVRVLIQGMMDSSCQR